MSREPDLETQCIRVSDLPEDFTKAPQKIVSLFPYTFLHRYSCRVPGVNKYIRYVYSATNRLEYMNTNENGGNDEPGKDCCVAGGLNKCTEGRGRRQQ